MIERVERGPGSAAELAAIAARAFEQAWSEDSFAAELEARGAAAWRCGAPGEPAVGYLLAHRVADEVEIRSLAITPGARRRGRARELLDRALRELEAEGARVAFLEVRFGNRAARALYTGAGFRVLGRRARYYPDGEDALVLSRELSPSRTAESRA